MPVCIGVILDTHIKKERKKKDEKKSFLSIASSSKMSQLRLPYRLMVSFCSVGERASMLSRSINSVLLEGGLLYYEREQRCHKKFPFSIIQRGGKNDRERDRLWLSLVTDERWLNDRVIWYKIIMQNSAFCKKPLVSSVVNSMRTLGQERETGRGRQIEHFVLFECLLVLLCLAPFLFCFSFEYYIHEKPQLSMSYGSLSIAENSFFLFFLLVWGKKKKKTLQRLSHTSTNPPQHTSCRWLARCCSLYSLVRLTVQQTSQC